MRNCKLSIITINLNNLSGLTKTFESVFSQTFKDYEYIVIDGGSQDGSKEFIQLNSEKIFYWISEIDVGIYNAMNKGIVRSNGEYILFLNSGDCLENREILKTVFDLNVPTDIIYGDVLAVKENHEKKISFPGNLNFDFFLTGYLPHPSSFIKKSLFTKYGLYNEKNKIVSDWEFFIKTIILYKASYQYLDLIISKYDLNGISAQGINVIKIREEKRRVLKNSFRHQIARNKNYKLVYRKKFYETVVFLGIRKLKLKVKAFLG